MQTYKEIEYNISETGGKWFYEIPEIGLSPQSIKPFVGGEIETEQQAETVAKAHIDIILLEKETNNQVTALVNQLDINKQPFLEVIENA